MAEAKDLNVKVRVVFDTNYPKVPSSMTERINALREAKGLVTASDKGVSGVIFGNQSGVPPTDTGVLTLLRLAEYITTGHDYLDTHPVVEQEGPSKKERRKAVKEMRKIVQEEVEEEYDRRQRDTNEAPEARPAEWWMPTPEEKADAEKRDRNGRDENHDDN
jgi:hypothetical protein